MSPKQYPIFQSTHPLRDATPTKIVLATIFPNFNPRTPYGMRHFLTLISQLLKIFQSTHPLRDATAEVVAGRDTLIFQSTHPLRDATQYLIHPHQDIRYFNPRTPYGMRLCLELKVLNLSNFNPRTPYGMRHNKGSSDHVGIVISIHAPLTGCDYDWHMTATVDGISIHAPLTGCDKVSASTILKISLFQSTHPLRDATLLDEVNEDRAVKFQSTHPLRDATVL